MSPSRDLCSVLSQLEPRSRRADEKLGGAAALATAASAQAADLPVKAAPVEYVKVCSLYGAGFFYIPGTDTCLKIGGYLRADHIYGMGNAGGYYMGTPSAQETRTSGDMYSYRARMNLTVDFRTQSDYGTIRAYAAIVGQQSRVTLRPTSERSGQRVGGYPARLHPVRRLHRRSRRFILRLHERRGLRLCASDPEALERA